MDGYTAIGKMPVISTLVEKVHDTYDWLAPSKKVKAEVPLHERIWKSVAQVFYTIVDALERIRGSTDGLDKTLKLLCSLSVGAMLLPFTDLRYWKWLSKELKDIDGVFSAVSVFGRYTAVAKMLAGPKPGERSTDEGPIKNASVSFLTVAKTCEFGRFMQGVGLLSTDWFVAMDANYLGGIVAEIGSESILGSMAFEVGLGGCKNFFLVLASSYAIINSGITVIDCTKDPKKGYLNVQRAAASIGADLGKIYLCTAAFTVAPIWVAIAFMTAVFSLTKILLDSYDKKGPVVYPNWMKA